MKVVVVKSPKFLGFFLRKWFHIQRNADQQACAG